MTVIRIALLLVLGSAPAISAGTVVVDELRLHKDDGKFARAVKEQLGVIGQDYFSDVEIGRAKNKHGYEPVDGFKRSFAGFHTEMFGTGEYAKNDWNFGLQTSGDNALIRANLQRLTSQKPSHLVGILNGAIDFSTKTSLMYLKYSSALPHANIDHIGMFGPWVFKRKSGRTSIEIHPMSQLWWTRKTHEGRTFHLLFLNDLSGQFQHYDDFAGDDHKASWQGNIRKGDLQPGTFAVAFEVRSGETRRFEISASEARRPILATSKRRRQTVTFHGQTLVTVEEIEQLDDLIEVRLDNVGLDAEAKKLGKSVVKGFIVIRTKYMGKASPDGKDENPGRLPFVIYEKGRAPADTKRYRVTLDQITCDGADDSGGVEEIIGYVGVRATSGVWPIQANVLPKGASPLLWSRQDDGSDHGPINPTTGKRLGALQLKKGQTETINRSSEYDLPESATLTLLADLDEDDDSDDDNTTKLDGDDDKLEKFCKTCFRNVEVKQLRKGQPLPVELKFASGGTLIRVSLKVEAL